MSAEFGFIMLLFWHFSPFCGRKTFFRMFMYFCVFMYFASE